MKHFLPDLEYWRAVVEAAGLGVWDYDIVTGEKNYSPRWLQIHGLTTAAEIIFDDETWFETLHPDDVAIARRFSEQINSGTALEVAFEYRERNPAGGWTWFMCRGRAIYHDKNGKATRFVGIDTDITAMKASEAAQAIAAKQLQNAVEIAEIGVWTYEIETQTAIWDARMKKIFGVENTPDHTQSNNWEQLLHPDDRERVFLAMTTNHALKSDFTMEYRIIRPDGELRHLRSRISYVAQGEHGPSFIGVNWDATEEITHTANLEAANAVAQQRLAALSLAQHELELLSTHDPLTGLANRRALDRYIATLSHINGDLDRVAVMLIDVDRLKQINDSYGHEVGDMVLVAVATVLKLVLAPRALVARTGGDEFVAVFSDAVSADHLLTLAQDASEAAAATAGTAPEVPVPTVSIGIAHSLDQPENFASLYRRADKALYQAKNAGRSRAVLA